MNIERASDACDDRSAGFLNKLTIIRQPITSGSISRIDIFGLKKVTDAIAARINNISDPLLNFYGALLIGV